MCTSNLYISRTQFVGYNFANSREWIFKADRNTIRS